MNEPIIDNASVERIKGDIRERMGVCPSFFLLAAESPRIMENLWQQARADYLDNPLPSLFKEKLFTYLSRFCNVPYCVARHCAFLLGNGHVAGDAACEPLAPDDVLQLIQQPAPTAAELDDRLGELAAANGPLDAWPEPDGQLETALLVCCVPVFRRRGNVERCQAELRRLLGATRYDHLMALLAFIHTAHSWTETHPDIEFENDLHQLFAEQQTLGEWIKSYPAAVNEELQQADDELAELRIHRSELELRVMERTAELRLAQAAARMGIWQWDVERGQVTWDATQFELFGMEPTTAITSETFFNLVHPDDRPEQNRVVKEVFESGTRYDTEFRIIRPDGETRWIAAKGDVIRDKNNKPLRLVGVNYDVTDRKTAEEDLKRREREFRTLAAKVPGLFAYVDRDQRYRHVNRGYQQAFARPASEILGRTVAEILGTQTYEVVRPQIAAALRGDEVTFERPFDFPSGEGTVHVNYVPDRDEQGHVQGFFSLITDITPQKRAERELARLAAIVDSSNDAIIGKDLDGTIQTWNDAAEQLYGYARDEVVGKPITILVPPDRHDEVATILERIRRGERVEPFETVRVRKDGQLIHISLTVSSIEDGADRIVGASTIARDITDRKRAEEALRESEARFRNIFDNAATGIAIADLQGNLQQCNKAYSTMLGYTEEELCQKNFASLVHPDDRGANLVEIRRLQAAEIPHLEVENRYVHNDGQTVWVHKFISVLPDETGQSSYMMTLVTDFTERKQAEQDLRDREARLSTVLDTAVDAIITIDDRGTVESLNQAACQLFGFAADEVIGENVNMLMPQPYRDEHDQYLRNYLQSGQAKIIGIGREVVGQRKDGSTFPMHLAVSEVQLSDRHLFTGIVRDISDLKDAQQKLVQSERLAAMGQMLSAIAHESRNALQRIQAGVDMLAFEHDEQSEAGEDLRRIARAREDLQRLFDELRSYAAPIKLDRSSRSLSKVWRQAWSHLEVARAGRDVELHEETNGVDLTCSVDAFRVEQVFRNLMENSLAACDDPARLQISCHESDLDGSPAVCVSWRDNGSGLTDEQKKRIFEAFFTTKPKGTGLGMAIAMRTVEAHQGTLRVGDAHDGGAEFLITLPRSS